MIHISSKSCKPALVLVHPFKLISAHLTLQYLRRCFAFPLTTLDQEQLAYLIR